MPALEAATFVLGTAIAKTACGLWAGDNKLVNEIGNGVIDKVASLLSGGKQQRQFRRIWEEAAELVSDRIEALLSAEFRNLPSHEQEATVLAVTATFEKARLTEDDLFRHDLDAGYLDRFLRSVTPDQASKAALSDSATRLYDLLLRESSAYTIEVARTLPTASMTALSELLSRNRQILDDLQTVLDRLPSIRTGIDFERDYMQLIANRLDRIELYGATVSESSRNYPLSVAYISLTAKENRDRHEDSSEASALAEMALEAPNQPSDIERILASADRLFVRGQAGIGKTTLLHWIAVNSARQSFNGELASWNGTVPFFIPLRRFATDLPLPSQFVSEVGRHIADEMPSGWVQAQLRAGRAIVLVDGIDELNEDRRLQAREWIGELVTSFPQSRYIVTSRPGAVPAEWLGNEDFHVAELAPMDRASVTVFVERWHEAMLEQSRTEAQRDAILGYQRRLLSAIEQNRHIRQLVVYPLLCALTCALHKDRHGHLPSSRMELYEVALHMLLERRDEERDIKALNSLSRTQKILLLQDLAYWLIRNGQSDASKEDVVERITLKLKKMPGASITPSEAYKILLERSGLVREPVHGRVDFVHRTFQEYLAAKEAVDEGDIRALILNAHLDQWQETIVMAAGHASPRSRKVLIEGLLRRAEKRVQASGRAALQLLALACLETSVECPEEVQEQVLEATKSLVPPKSVEYADMLSRAGSLSLDLLLKSSPTDAEEIALTIRALGRIGDPAAIPFLSGFGRDLRPAISDALVDAWPHFDPNVFARLVLADCRLLPSGKVVIKDERLLPAMRHLKHLRSISFEDSRPTRAIDLSFVKDVPRLKRLRIPATVDLAPLAGSFLTSLNIGGLAKGPLDISPLVGVPTLTQLVLPRTKLISIGLLSRLTRLTWLALPLREFAAFSQFPEAAQLSQLRHAVVSECRPSDSVDFLTRWSDLAEVRLLGDASGDLGPLANLRHLSTVLLFARGKIDGHSLQGVKNLKHLSINTISPNVTSESVKEAASLEGLQKLSIQTFGAGTLDLRPVSHLKHLEVIVRPHGRCELLGSEGIARLSVSRM